jgi:hypothetical protein
MSAAARLLLAIALFAAWIGYLLYLVGMAQRPIVLSRPQLLVSNLDVIADVEGEGQLPTKVTVRQVHFPQAGEVQKLVGSTIPVSNLSQCEGWTSPGRYIVPLLAGTKDTYRVAPLPPSPGLVLGHPRIYPVTPETLEQLSVIRKPHDLVLP